MRALASPVRIEIVGVFQSYGALAIRELAEKLSRPMDGLYHHVRLLQKVGIVRVARTRRVGKRDESVYELTAERFGHQASPQTAAMKRTIVETATAALRLAGREFERAILLHERSNELNRPAESKLSRQKSWLTEADLTKLHRMLNKIESFLQKRLHRKEGQPFALTTVLVPLLKRKRV